ncbi:MAG: Smr/MutS family protein [Desulfococcaceae bacterium]
MFSLLKKIFAQISGKTEKQVFREKESQSPDTHGNKRKSGRKDSLNQGNIHKKIQKNEPSGAQKAAVPVQSVQKKKSSHPLPSGKKNRKASAKVRDRHGIPVYEKHTDFSKYFAEEPQKPETAAKESQTESPALPKPKRVREKTGKECQTESLATTKPKRVRGKKQITAKANVRTPGSVPRNKHGIPLFREEDDFFRYFRDENSGEMYRQSPERSTRFPQHSLHNSLHSNDAADDFQTLLHQSLGERGMEDMLKKKFEGQAQVPPKPLRKKIAEYPPPQEVMDLHGCTADQAEEKTEAFIRRARHKGMRTLLIIVGKGLHSEGKAVLPDVVENRLVLLKQKNWVLSYEWEKKIQRKSGAVIVYLIDLG